MEDEIKLARLRRVVEFLKAKGHTVVSAGTGSILVDRESHGQYDLEAKFRPRYEAEWPTE